LIILIIFGKEYKPWSSSFCRELILLSIISVEELTLYISSWIYRQFLIFIRQRSVTTQTGRCQARKFPYIIVCALWQILQCSLLIPYYSHVPSE
jgi:hypothetical protein